MRNNFTTSVRLFICFLLLIGITITPRLARTESNEPPKMKSLIGMTLDPSQGTFIPLNTAQPMPHPKLDSAMTGLLKDPGMSLQKTKQYARDKSLRIMDERVHAVVRVRESSLEQARQLILDKGGDITGISTVAGIQIQCWVPIPAIEYLIEDSAILSIRRPSYALPDPEPEIIAPSVQNAGIYTTEALTVMNAHNWHAQQHTGAGIRVAVIDIGFEGYTSLLGTELPASVTTNNFVDSDPDPIDGTDKHGTACAEIIHDIAPGAQLYFAKIKTPQDVEEAATWLISQEVDIISSSLRWNITDPGDGTGFFPAIVENARNNGILWVTGAGNERLLHWGGTFDPMTGILNGYSLTFHRWGTTPVSMYYNCWGPFDTINCDALPGGKGYWIGVRWEDDWDAPTTDYDLYVGKYNGSGFTVIAESYNTQDGSPGQKPVEEISFTTSGETPAAYGFFLRTYSGQPNVNIEFFTPNGAGFLKFGTTSRSIGNLADAPDAITVGAVDVDSLDQENYSSEGPTNGPNCAADGGSIKPDIAGYANVSTASYGTKNFAGTSAATPHVAGAAALVMGTYIHYSLDKVENYLEKWAMEAGDPGKDNRFGEGILFLGPPMNANMHAVYLLMLLSSQ